MNKTDVENLGISTIDSTTPLSDSKRELIEQVKALLPNAITSDNTLDINALHDLIGTENTNSNNQGYELTFAGKGLARHKADTETDKELQYVESQSKDKGEHANTENTIIRGDNLDVLKILKQNYTGKIKMIYIDPPYNTAGENFIYNDNFKQSEQQLIDELGLGEDTVNFIDNMYGTRSHSGWLAFMYPRLKLARELLTEDGVIFISIDDNEQANLKVLCDEIFGEKQVETYVWNLIDFEESSFTKTASNTVRAEHEYVLGVYKNEKQLSRYEEYRYKDRDDFDNPDNDPRGNWMSGNISRNGIKTTTGEKYYEIVTPTGISYKRNWTLSKEQFEEYRKDNRIHFAKDGDGVPREKIFQNEPQQSIQSSMLSGLKTSITGKKQVNELMKKEEVFGFPKPTNLIDRLMIVSDTKDNLILDFFAGSGTTFHAVMNLNASDGGKRKCILVQWDEEIDGNDPKKKIPYDFCIENNFEPVISSITIERVNRAGNTIKKENPMACPDIGYRVFTLTDKQKIGFDDNQYTIQTQRQNIQDTLYNMMVATGVPLHTKIETITEDVLYKIKNSLYIVGTITPETLSQQTGDYIYIDGTINFDLTNYLNLGIHEKDNIKVIF